MPVYVHYLGGMSFENRTTGETRRERGREREKEREEGPEQSPHTHVSLAP